MNRRLRPADRPPLFLINSAARDDILPDLRSGRDQMGAEMAILVELLKPLAVAALLFLVGVAPAAARNSEADRELNFARQMLSENMPQSATSHFRGFIEEYPEHTRIAEARWGLAKSYELTNDSRALDAWKSYLKHHPSGENAPEAWLGLGKSLFAQARWSEARAAFSDYLARFPNATDRGMPIYYEGLCLIRMDRPIEAAPLFEKAATLLTGEMKSEAAFSYVSALHRAGKTADAAEGLYVVATEHKTASGGAKARGLLGDILYREGKYVEARENYTEALKGNLSYADEIRFWRAMCAVKLNDLATANTEFFELARMHPHSRRAAQALRLVAEMGASRKDTELVLDAAARLLDLPSATDEDRSEAWYRKGRTLFDLGRHPEARVALLEVLKLDLYFVGEAEFLLGAMSLTAGEYPEAESHLRSAMASAEGTELEVPVLMALLDLFRATERVTEYSELAKKVEKSRPDVLPTVMMRAGEMMERRGDFIAAAAQYTEVQKRFPESREAAAAAYSMGLIRYSQGDYAGAEKDFLRFIRKANEGTGDAAFQDDAWYWIGFSRYQRDRMDDAIAAFLEVTKFLDSNLRNAALLRAGDAAFRLEKYPDALAYYDSLIKSEAADTQTRLDALYNRASALRNLGQAMDAHNVYLEAWRLGGAPFEDALLKAGESLEDAGQRAEAAVEYESAAIVMTSPGRKEEAFFRAARVRESLGELEQAERLFEKTAEFEGSMAPDALYSVGMLQLRSGDSEAASLAFRAASESYPKTLYGRMAALEFAVLTHYPDTAIALIKKIITSASGDPAAAAAYLRLAVIYRVQNNLDNAVEALKKALEILPEDENLAKAKLLIGEIYFAQKDYRGARRQLEFVFRSPLYAQSPHREEAGKLLAKTLMQLGEDSAAVNILKEMADTVPKTATGKSSGAKKR